MIVVTKAGLVLVDTPCNDEQAARLLRWARSRLDKRVVLAIVTSFHGDRLGGVRALLAERIPVCATARTAALTDTSKYPRPSAYLPDDTTLTIGGTRIQTHFPGAGHSADNIVVWLPHRELLFGGSLVKSAEEQSLGNVADADLDAWPLSILRLIDRFPYVKIVVPGHGRVGTVALLAHTGRLLRER